MTTSLLAPQHFYHPRLFIVVLQEKVNALVKWTAAQSMGQCALADNIDLLVSLF